MSMISPNPLTETSTEVQEYYKAVKDLKTGVTFNFYLKDTEGVKEIGLHQLLIAHVLGLTTGCAIYRTEKFYVDLSDLENDFNNLKRADKNIIVKRTARGSVKEVKSKVDFYKVEDEFVGYNSHAFNAQDTVELLIEETLDNYIEKLDEMKLKSIVEYLNKYTIGSTNIYLLIHGSGKSLKLGEILTTSKIDFIDKLDSFIGVRGGIVILTTPQQSLIEAPLRYAEFINKINDSSRIVISYGYTKESEKYPDYYIGYGYEVIAKFKNHNADDLLVIYNAISMEGECNILTIDLNETIKIINNLSILKKELLQEFEERGDSQNTNDLDVFLEIMSNTNFKEISKGEVVKIYDGLYHNGSSGNNSKEELIARLKEFERDVYRTREMKRQIEIPGM